MSRSKKEKKIRSFSPIYTILIMTVLIMVISFVLSLIGFDAQKAVITASPFTDVPYVVEMTLTTVKNAFSIDGIKFIINNVSSNLQMFNPLILLLITLIGISVGETSGLFKRWFSKLRSVKLDVITFLTLFISIISVFFGEEMYLFLIPLFAVIYKHAGRNPVLGILTTFIGITVGYGAGLFINYNGYLIGSVTEIAANIERNNNFIYNLQSTLFINIASTLLLSIFGAMAIKHFMLPKIPKKICVTEEESTENKGLLITNIVAIILTVMFIYSMIPGLPFSGGLLDSTQNNYVAKLMSNTAPFRQGFIYIITIMFMILGFVYGFINGQFKNSHDFNLGLSKGFEKLGYLFVMMFFALQMIALLEWTNIGEVLTAKLVDLLGVLQFSGLPLIIAFVGLIFILTIVVPSAITKWNLIAPVAIPLFMRSNITPDFTQFIFTSIDGVSKAFTPIFVYFLIMVGFIQKYNEEENITIFGTLSLMLPTMVMMIGIWIMIIIGWYIIGLPIGLNVFPTI